MLNKLQFKSIFKDFRIFSTKRDMHHIPEQKYPHLPSFIKNVNGKVMPISTIQMVLQTQICEPSAINFLNILLCFNVIMP